MASSWPGQIADFGLGPDVRFDHVAVAAPRLRDLLPLYHGLLGGQVVVGGDNPMVGYRALQLAYQEDRRVELMEPLAGSTFFDRFFQRCGGGGMHHMTFLVPDIHAALRAVEGRGYTPASVFLDNPTWQEVFLHPKQASGTLIQLVQAAKGPRTSLRIEDVLAGHGAGGTGIPSP